MSHFGRSGDIDNPSEAFAAGHRCRRTGLLTVIKRRKESARAQRLMSGDTESDGFVMWWKRRRAAHHLVSCYHGDLFLLPSLFCHLPCSPYHMCISVYVLLVVQHATVESHANYW